MIHAGLRSNDEYRDPTVAVRPQPKRLVIDCKHEPEQVISEMPVQRGMLNPYGVVHAGAILWLADVTATLLAMGSTETGKAISGFPLAINLNANFTGNQKAGKLRAVASFVKRGKTVSIVRTLVLGENDKLIAEVSTNHLAAR